MREEGGEKMRGMERREREREREREVGVGIECGKGRGGREGNRGR